MSKAMRNATRFAPPRGPISVSLACAAAIAVVGWGVSKLPNRGLEAPPWLAAAPTGPRPLAQARPARDAELRDRFNQGVVMLHAREYEYAVKALHRVLELAPRMPEAHVNMGFALLGQAQHAVAADFFTAAIDLHPGQANAWYGLAVALDELGDREVALGAMRTFVHLAGEAEAPFLPRARAAIWEWQAAAQAAVVGPGDPQ